MNLRREIGNTIRILRDTAKLSQEELASQSKISYQYLSLLENGRKNFSIGILEKITNALAIDLLSFINIAYGASNPNYPKINPDYIRDQVPLPGNLSTSDVTNVLNETQRIIAYINENLSRSGARILQSYIQGNNFSGLVSNILCDSFNELTNFKHNSHQAYPDLIYSSRANSQIGLEIKTTINVGKGGESHNGHSGWHLITCYKIIENGHIIFIHAMFAELRSHTEDQPDWKYLGSRENPDTGSRRTETYTTNLYGTTKLRDGSVYLDPNFVSYNRWKQSRYGSKGSW
jgi:transcriptional regulator with XRE-family HTH domain